ncbi:MAG: hypothetical protein IJ146_09660 [Kiritimatiellae bacterium]|nr:hypothetical protein [Kiritimatiellia bacterium]
MTPDDERIPLADIALERKRLARDGALRRRLADHLVPGLPVDADACELRVPEVRVGSVLGTLVDELTTVKEPFFDTVCERWKDVCPDVPARPGRYRDGRLFLYVGTSGLVFSLRPKLAKIKKRLLALPGAPAARRLSLHLEVHAPPRTKH